MVPCLYGTEMHDICKQLALSWARRGPQHRIDAGDDFTRLTLDTIALCAMDYRFNSFYQEARHPYVEAMNTVLSGAATRQNPVVSKFWGGNAAVQVTEARKVQNQIAATIVEERRKHPKEKRDLLNAMVNGRDPKTGEHLSDRLISANMNTFLVAGHETTSSLLSFVFYNLLKHPATYRAAQEEVDRVVGTGAVVPHHLKELEYLNGVLRECLRLYPTAPGFT